MNYLLLKNKNILISILTMIIILLIDLIFVKENLIYYYIFNFLLLSLFLNITSYNVKKIKKLNTENQVLELYNKSLSEEQDNLKSFKHDFNNIIQAIGGYISLNNMKGLQSYYNDLTNDIQNINYTQSINPDFINNPAIFNVLNQKYFIAKDNLIQMDISVCLDLSTLQISNYEISRILGILLDNSIEATKNCNNIFIKVDFLYDRFNKRQIIIVENTYEDKDINLEKIFEKGFTSKENNSGIGLWQVKKIVDKNSKLNLSTTKNKNTFKQQLDIYI